MSKIIGDSACPQCRSMGRDSQGNHLIHFEDGGRHCNRCGYTVKPDGSTTEEDDDSNMAMTMEVVKTLPNASLKARGIRKDVAERYGFRVEYNPANGEEAVYYAPLTESGKVVGYKVRRLPKSFTTIGETKGKHLEPFGLSTCQSGGKKIVITGGFEDCLAASQMLADYSDSKYGKGKYPPNVISLTRGEKDIQCIADHLEEINSFEEIILCLDMDEVGRESTRQLVDLLGPKAKIMKLPEKDPNDMLLKGKEKGFIDAFFKAEQYRPEEIITVDDVWDTATEIPVYGRAWPWSSLTKLTYGRRGGEGIYVGAGPKVGKTEFLTQMIDHIIQKEGLPVFGAKFEQGAGLTFQTIAGKKDRKAYHNPDTYADGRVTKGDLEKAIDSVRDKVYLFNAGYSDAGQGDLWERLKSAIRYAVVVKGVKDVFIDPITQLTDGISASDTDTYLRKFSNEMQALAQELDFFYYIFVHLKEPQTGPTHEEGGKVKSAQFRGSRAMAEKTKFLLGIERNILADDETERNTSTFRLLLNSGFGKPGSFEVVYNPETTEYLEPERSF